ncbi:hypothetical protein AAH972_12735 [Enterococcus faecalis]|uniref:hypothetical protein n=1 Tax=Enterococcus faecalis TaxID=1351 RepID=UPI00032DFD16|nr:hypothetical protein [Enterococcus faecalis]EOJ55305.1 hypothetical protein WMM_02816 [Enterococcus faecalis EnGen0364]
MMHINNLRDIMLSKTQVKKLNIIYQLRSGSVLISILEKKCKVSRKELKRIITIINEEVTELQMFNISNDLIYVIEEEVQLNREISDEMYCFIMTKLRKNYLLSSGVYKALLFALEERKFMILDLSDFLFYSDSYTYKIIKKIDLFFYYLESDIKLTKKNNKYLITGSEISLITFHFLLAMLVSDEETWIFKNVKKNCHVYYVNKSKKKQLLVPLNQTRPKVLLAVFEVSKIKGRSISSASYINNRIGKIMFNEEVYSLDWEIRLLNNNEQLYRSFFIHYFCQELRDKQQKRIIGKKLSEYSNDDKLVSVIVDFLNDIKKYYCLSDKHYYEVLYTIYKHIIVIHHLELYRYMCNDDCMVKEAKIVQSLEEVVKKHFNKYSNEKSYSQLKCSLMPIVISYIQLNNIQSKKVYVEFNHHSEYRAMIINKLKLHYSEKVLKIVDDYRNADIIIGDCTCINQNRKIFVYHGRPDSSTWNCLKEFLNELLYIQ